MINYGTRDKTVYIFGHVNNYSVFPKDISIVTMEIPFLFIKNKTKAPHIDYNICSLSQVNFPSLAQHIVLNPGCVVLFCQLLTFLFLWNTHAGLSVVIALTGANTGLTSKDGNENR